MLVASCQLCKPTHETDTDSKQPNHLQAIASRCSQLRGLDLSYNAMISSDALVNLLEHCTRLEELDISACPQAMSDSVLQAIGQHCQQLITLYAEHDQTFIEESSNVPLSCTDPLACTFTEHGLSWLAQGCRQLQVSGKILEYVVL